MSKLSIPSHYTVGEQAERSWRTKQELTGEELWLLQVMREHQFGRIELLPIENGRLRPGPETRIVRVARLGGEGDVAKPNLADNFELKQAARDLFRELARLQNCIVLRLEFRFGQPCLLETEARLVDTQETPSLS